MELSSLLKVYTRLGARLGSAAPRRLPLVRVLKPERQGRCCQWPRLNFRVQSASFDHQLGSIQVCSASNAPHSLSSQPVPWHRDAAPLVPRHWDAGLSTLKCPGAPLCGGITMLAMGRPGAAGGSESRPLFLSHPAGPGRGERGGNPGSTGAHTAETGAHSAV